MRPNPFNPIALIAFRLETAGSARLTIYDLQGRAVRTLGGGGVLEAGRHEAMWDGRDDRGRHVPAGTYLCRLVAGGQADSRRLVLLK